MARLLPLTLRYPQMSSIRRSQLNQSRFLAHSPFSGTDPQAHNRRLHEIKNIEGLRKAGKPSPEPVEIETPSWADLENQHGIASRNLTLEGIKRASLFDASAGKPAPPAPLRYTCSPNVTKTRVLTVSVVHVGTISSETRFTTILATSNQPINASLVPLPAQPGDLLSEPYITGGTEYDALWRTLCADAFFVRGGGTGGVDGGTAIFRRAVESDVKAMQAWRRWVGRTGIAKALPPPQDPSSSEEDALIADADRAIRSAYTMRRYFKTDTKYMGLTAYGAMPGDEVFVLLGSSTPFALRPLGEAAVEGLGDAVATRLLESAMSTALWMRSWLRSLMRRFRSFA